VDIAPTRLIAWTKWSNFLKGIICQKLTQEKIDNQNRSISIKEIESLINNLPKQKAPGQRITHQKLAFLLGLPNI
jgi:hypothetical protein